MAGFLSKFRDRVLVGRMADALGIEDVRRYPTQLNTEAVQPVFDLGTPPLAQPGSGRGATVRDSNLATGVTPTAETVEARLITDAQSYEAEGGIIWDPVSLFRIDHIDAYLDFDNAGWTAYAGKFVRLEILKRSVTDAADEQVLYRTFFRVYGGINTAFSSALGWSLAGGAFLQEAQVWPHPPCIWNRIFDPKGEFSVPRYILLARFVGIDGTAFPANTKMYFYIEARKSKTGVPSE